MASPRPRTGSKRPSRVRERERLLAAAAQVDVPSSCDVCVIGAGASGLVAAITAAEAGASVIAFESGLECGRTILATGNGRCNFANVDLSASHYNCPEFVAEAMGEHPLDDILSFFGDCGLAWCEEEGRLYPASRVAASVRNVLLERCEDAGVRCAPARRVTRLARHGRRLLVCYEEGFSGNDTRTISAGAVIAATGGATHRIAADLGIPLVDPKPILCPVACEDSPVLALDGRRAHAAVTLERDGRTIFHECGEVMLRSYGLSGIVVFDLSRHARVADSIMLDLVPSLPCDELARRLELHANRHGRIDQSALDGYVDPAIGHLVVRLASTSAPSPRSDEVAQMAKAMRFKVEGLADTEHAQVTRGGLSTAAFDPETLGSRTFPNLFASGEALDVDGPCGGYNLAWAWSSGMLAGTNAAQATRGAIAS